MGLFDQDHLNSNHARAASHLFSYRAITSDLSVSHPIPIAQSRVSWITVLYCRFPSLLHTATMSPAATSLSLTPSFVCTITPATPPQSPSKASFHNPTPPPSPPSTQTSFRPAQYLSPPPGRPGGPKLSLDTSQERLQKYTVVNHDGQSYLKLFSPVLVESPVSFLTPHQLFDDKKLWENGPDVALQTKIDTERREAFKARSRQQLRGFLLGIWLGCLMGLLILQQTSAKVYIPSQLAR
ncbi:hypothetical protein B0O80DRAFT_39296 [Mortierella sp. GBAus27b]|nr:hypothetical protein B0O80DRAFT_39296 [Mortierella sp. GBAus27b]